MLLAMMMTKHIVVLAKAFAKSNGISVATLSGRLFKDARKIEQLDNGRDLVTGRYEAALQYFAENWPDDLDWPADIPRPSVAA